MNGADAWDFQLWLSFSEKKKIYKIFVREVLRQLAKKKWFSFCVRRIYIEKLILRNWISLDIRHLRPFCDWTDVQDPIFTQASDSFILWFQHRNRIPIFHIFVMVFPAVMKKIMSLSFVGLDFSWCCWSVTTGHAGWSGQGAPILDFTEIFLIFGLVWNISQLRGKDGIVNMNVIIIRKYKCRLVFLYFSEFLYWVEVCR